MDERCALCGNRTAQMDLDVVAFEGLEVKACPYCRKQLEQTLKNPAQNSDWLQSILQVDTKGVRSDEVTAALTRICYQNDIPRPQTEPAAPVIPAPAPVVAVPPVPAANTVPAAQSEAEKTTALEARVTALEQKLHKMQRRMLLSKILGTVIPLLVVCILAIILVRSEYFQNILDYYDQLGELANRM